ncbi:MAG: hypothetical protein K8F53_13065 [Rhodocyclaceae bacterium]|nr:hypothetical protein [Rhodocyclaceae bacterium]
MLQNHAATALPGEDFLHQHGIFGGRQGPLSGSGYADEKNPACFAVRELATQGLCALLRSFWRKVTAHAVEGIQGRRGLASGRRRGRKQRRGGKQGQEIKVSPHTFPDLRDQPVTSSR